MKRIGRGKQLRWPLSMLRSVLNFAANAASDETEGCFHLRTLDMIPRSRSFKAKGAGGMYGTDSTYLCSSSLFWNAEVERSPLSRRGWVLQERATTPRTLHFGKCRIGELATRQPLEINILPDSGEQVWKGTSLGDQLPTIVQKSFLSPRLFGLSGTLLQPGHGHLCADQ